MNTRYIYERIMLGYYSKVKYLRNSWNGESYHHLTGVATLIDLGGEEYRQFSFIMDKCNDIIFDLLTNIIVLLLKEYKIPVKFYDLRKAETELYYIGNDGLYKEYNNIHEEKKVLAFSRIDKHQERLYVFKKYGINHRVPRKTLDGLMKEKKIKEFCYISYVEDDAFIEVINHNNDENDPTRGTGIFSLSQFFEDFFGIDEYKVFKEYAKQFSTKVRDYLGFAIVRTLKPNAILNFKKYALEEIKKINMTIIPVTEIEESQRAIIFEHFINEKNYEILLGNSNFATSFLTAEWLYSSLSNTSNIDFTAIAMGYLKSVEKLLFQFIKLHTKEKDHCKRTIHFKGENTDLTDTFINDKQNEEKITLGNLTGFFGYYNAEKKRYSYRNEDLLVDGINSHTHEFIIRQFKSIVELRNGFFHKDNLDRWSIVTEIRTTAHLFYCLLLGTYKLSENDKKSLGLIRVNEYNDYDKLCAYVNRKAFDSNMLVRPILYIINNSMDSEIDPYSFGLPYQDDYIEYDNYGEPNYSGFYVKEIGEKGKIFKFTKDCLPKEIWEGALEISQNIPITITPTGPKRKIFVDGKYVGD